MREYFKKWPKLYYAIVMIFGPTFLFYKGSSYFIKKYGNGKINLNLGSGPLRINNDYKNVDLLEFEGVDLVENLEKMSFADNSVDRIVLDNVLEHVENPRQVVSEMHRVMKSDSLAYVSTPFIYPFHSSPYDYQRFTHMGLRKLFENFEVVELGTRSSIFSALNTYLVYFFATLFSFGNEKFYDFLTNILIFVFFPIKFLDIFILWNKTDINSACVFYMVVRKR